MKKFLTIFFALLFFTVSVFLGYIIFHKEYIYQMNGSSFLTLRLGEEYIENGISVKYGNLIKKEDLNYDIESNLDINKIGEYTITYTVKKNNAVYKRVINVIDDEPPIIQSIDEVDVLSCQSKVDIDYTAIDNYDSDLTPLIERFDFEDYILLKVKDSSANEAIKKVSINKKEEGLANITLNGNENVYVLVGKSYVEKGATAKDNCGNDLSSKITISSNVNTQQAGTYKVKYSVKNGVGKVTTATRNVIVYNYQAPAVNSSGQNKVLYLTFDDGPGKYTSKILDVLKEKNVKATFFVTNQFPSYQNLITREYNEGHAIGIHTYSHNYKTIYSTVDGFMKDLEMMNQLIYNKTGSYSKIMRFAGGSSNTVSRSYATGIMSALATKVTENGYIYFDWNLNSGDTNGMNAKQIYNNTISSLGNGSKIILMHDIKYNTLVALPDIIDYALANGYQFDVLSSQSFIVHSKINN